MLFITLDICLLFFNLIRGSEISIIAEAHFQLYLGEIDNQKEMTEKETQEEFRTCYNYGTSRSNQRMKLGGVS